MSEDQQEQKSCEAQVSIEGMKRVSVWWGIAVMLLGMLAILAPVISGIAIAVVVGIALTAAGVVQVIFTFHSQTFGRGLLSFLFGAITIAAGVLTFLHPVLGLETLTLVLIAYFFVDAIYHFITAFRVSEGRGWLVFGGVASALLAGIILFDWPVSGMWAVGIVVGVRLLIVGVTMTILSKGKVDTNKPRGMVSP